MLLFEGFTWRGSTWGTTNSVLLQIVLVQIEIDHDNFILIQLSFPKIPCAYAYMYSHPILPQMKNVGVFPW